MPILGYCAHANPFRATVACHHWSLVPNPNLPSGLWCLQQSTHAITVERSSQSASVVRRRYFMYLTNLHLHFALAASQPLAFVTSCPSYLTRHHTFPRTTLPGLTQPLTCPSICASAQAVYFDAHITRVPQLVVVDLVLVLALALAHGHRNALTLWTLLLRIAAADVDPN